MPFAVALNSSACTYSFISGGKGSSLALMIKKFSTAEAGRPKIPPGVCLTSEAHAVHLRMNPELKDCVADIVEEANAIAVDRKSLENACKK